MAGPNTLTIRMYHVGFGDCFLLTFHYATVDRHLLIDFGTTRQSKKYMQAVAEDIKAQCGERLDAVLVSHRHKDHMCGFATDDDPAKRSSGKMIAELSPQLVSLTWTEDPDLDEEATGPVQGNETLSYLSTLKSMQQIAERAALVAEAARRAKRYAISSELADLSEMNISNKAALQNLLNMAASTEYLHYASKTELNSLFRGVRFHVLGPPTVEQSRKIKRQVSRDKDEYWHLANYWRLLDDAFEDVDNESGLFPKRLTTRIPSSAKWLVDQMGDPLGSNLLHISRIMDSAINNTSIILLVELWGTKLLFSGDAQIENWDYALNGPHKQRNRELLSGVDVYKVGHHASLNGTPKTLWSLFTKRKDLAEGGGLISLLSSRQDIHGKEARGTEVPRGMLLTALKKGSDLFSTPYAIHKQTKFKNVECSELEIEFV